jgi:endonuclease YncB( thermonuclease family)
MAKGFLEVRGRIAIEQFWPEGESDADTTKIHVEVGEDSFRFKEHPGAEFHNTHAFDRARVRGRVTKPIINQKSRITIRLQGVDAPELHYMPQAANKKNEQTAKQRKLFLEWNHKYRQHFAEAATVALKTLLETEGEAALTCRVLTVVDEPNDAIDTYGRLVGDIEVKIGGELTNLNQWLTKNGWTIPAFYNSMSADEIRTLLELGEQARSKKRGFWPELSSKIGTFDFDLRYRRSAPAAEPDDSGPILMPKLFRRQTTWTVNKKAGMVIGTFKQYLQKKTDNYYLIDDFLEQGVTAALSQNLGNIIGPRGILLRRPQDLVFSEEGAKLLGPNGNPPKVVANDT